MSPEILAAIPHRPPMLLVDEVVSRGENKIVCRKTFHADEFFFQGHYPGQPLVPGVILCEAGMQAGAVLLSSLMTGIPGKPVVARLSDAKFKQMVLPGDTIEIEVTHTERVRMAFYFESKIYVGEKLALTFGFVCMMANVADAAP